MTISHSQVVANNFPNLRTIQFMLFTLDSDRDPFNVCAILLCEDLADSIILQINILAKLNHLDYYYQYAVYNILQCRSGESD